MSLVPNDSLAVVRYTGCGHIPEQSSLHAQRRSQQAENRYLHTYKALHLGGKDTAESRLIRSVFICATHSENETAERIFKYNKVTSYLSRLTNEQLSKLLTNAHFLSRGIGGDVVSMHVEGVPLIAKKIRLTAIEQQHPGSTRNLFELPPYYQYGVGSMGFGAWRELAAHEMTTQWVLNGECHNFPLMYHARVMQRAAPSPIQTAAASEERRRDVEYWDGSVAVGQRLAAADTASADVIVFMEHLSQTLHKWVRITSSEGSLTERVITKLERELTMVAAFMKSRGFLHFDAHFHNLMASNNHVYFADFGLATSRRFDLSAQERAFFEQHRDYDCYYIVAELAKRMIATATVPEEQQALLDTYLSTRHVITRLPPAVASIAQRYRSIASLMNTFFQRLRTRSKGTPYPTDALEHEWAKIQIR